MSSSPSLENRFTRDVESNDGPNDTDSDGDADTFHIPGKKAPVERLRRWRRAALVLNATRRFRYTLDLKKEEEKYQTTRKIRAHAQAIRAAFLFKEAGRSVSTGASEEFPPPAHGFGIGCEKLAALTREHDTSSLREHGGVEGLANLLKTDLDKGIPGDDSETLVQRREAFGSNTYPRKMGKSFWVFLWEAFQDKTLIALMVAVALSLGFGIKSEGIKEGWYDGASIAFAVLLVVLVTASSDYKQSLQFQGLNEEKRNIKLEVVRGGRRSEVSIFDLVVGDVVPLNIGDQVPADGVLIVGHSLATDESSMTGESNIVHKDQKNPFLMSGCKVADGYGNMLVTGVGLNTEWGLLMASISEDNGEETPLQVRLNGVATLIGFVGVGVAGIVFLVLLIRLISGHTKNPDGSVQFRIGKNSVDTLINRIVKIATIGVTIIVVAVPEGLPLAVTLTLAYSMRKMMMDKALVRRLSACETMGSATTICSDKTGTLTMNQMTIVRAVIGGKTLEAHDKKELSETALSLLTEGIAQNTTGTVFISEDGMVVDVTGSPTEKAILSWGIKLGMKFEELRSQSSVLRVFPFNSEKKRGGVAIQLSESDVHIHWKGAAEMVLASCTQWLDEDGSLQQINPDKESEFEDAIERMAEESLRCVAFAFRQCDVQDIPIIIEQQDDWTIPESDLVLLAIVGIKDPCRPGVKEAVKICQDAGVKVRMVTGDNIQTAKAIALECGILQSEASAVEPVIIEGRTFHNYSETERQSIARQISVMGRSSPNDKLLLVRALRRNGDVVAVTGDGTNDAPALHEADIGLAMGIEGTEVAKESSDIIILDDNFSSLVKVVRWGRSVYANIQKFIQFQVTVNVAALVVNVVAAVSAGDVPLKAVQLLWVNLIMDTLGALALATEPPTDELMHREPVGRRDPLITNIMWRNIMIQAFYQVTILLVFKFRGTQLLNLTNRTRTDAEKLKNTFIFNAFVMCQVFNEFNCRKPEKLNVFSGITRNHLFIGIIAVTVVFQVLIVEFVGKFASTVKLSWQLWLVSVALGFISWPLAILGKLIPVPETPYLEYFRRICCFKKDGTDDDHAQQANPEGKNMSCPPNTIYYCSISAGAKILATFSCGDQETDMWAALCLENIPPLHAWYFQRFRNRFFAFLMEDRHVFFVIADESLGKTGVFDFLGCVRENFRRVIQSGAKGSNRLTSFCLRDALRPVLMRLVHNINGSPNLTQGNMGDMGVVIESYPSGPLTKSSSMETSGQQIAQRTWCRHLWIALAIDLMLCLILFGIWLGVCGSFTCLSS